MKRIFTALFLLLMTGVALAQDGDALGTAQQFGATLTPPMSDFSVAYLSQIFGTVGNVLVGTSGQVLGKMFDIFNKGVLVVAALWLCMTTVQTCLRAATEGSFMGQNKNVHMIMLRIALGFGLIIPSSTTGYSVLQDVFMKIVVAGVGLADETWDTALTYLKYGGELYYPPGNMGNDTKYVSAFLGSKTTPGPAAQIFADEVCMLSSGSMPGKFSPIYFPSSHVNTIGFPGGSDASSLTDPTQASCGAVKMFCAKGICPSPDTSSQPTQTGMSYEYSSSALKQMVIAMMPAAQNYYENNCDAGTCSDETRNNIGKAIFAALMGYGNLITPYQNIANQWGASNKPGSGFFSQAEESGWIMAGGFYWNVEQSNRDAQSLTISNLLPVSINSYDATPHSITTSTVPPLNFVTTSSTSGGIADYVSDLWSDYIGAQQNQFKGDKTATARGSGADTNTGPAGAMAGNALGDAVSNLYNLGQNQGYNPIVVLMHEGNTLLITVVLIWTGAIVMTFALATFLGICDSMSPGGLILKTAISWMKSIIMLVTSALLIPGAIMAYYVPMYPFAIFTFAAIGWFGMVIEGMAAAPLVCLGMTHPEGHDFLGKAEQALMLFLSIFLRPTLMVIGLISFMITSFVAFEMLMAGFGTLMNAITTGYGQGGALNDGFLILINITMIMVIFGMMTMEVIEQSAKLIYQIPNNINKWIGAPGMGEEYGQMAAALKGGVSTAAEVTGKAASTAAEGAEVGGQAARIGAEGGLDKTGGFKSGKGSVKTSK